MVLLLVPLCAGITWSYYYTWFYEVPGIEPRTPCMLDKCSTSLHTNLSTAPPTDFKSPLDCLLLMSNGFTHEIVMFHCSGISDKYVESVHVQYEH